MDILSSLLGGNSGGNLGAIGALLPLLLGGKGTGDLGGLIRSLGQNNPLAALAPMLGSKPSENSYPPLFGAKEPPLNLISSLLQNGGKNPDRSEENNQPATSYPYELQYNRPENINKK